MSFTSANTGRAPLQRAYVMQSAPMPLLDRHPRVIPRKGLCNTRAVGRVILLWRQFENCLKNFLQGSHREAKENPSFHTCMSLWLRQQGCNHAVHIQVPKVKALCALFGWQPTLPNFLSPKDMVREHFVLHTMAGTKARASRPSLSSWEILRHNGFCSFSRGSAQICYPCALSV